jgi:hypothetical protein
MANRPRNPFFNPYRPPAGLLGERAQASTVPSAAGFCSSYPVTVLFEHGLQVGDTAQVATRFFPPSRPEPGVK